MAEPTVWERKEITGTLKSAERKTNQNNREFMTVVIDDQEYSAWEDATKTMAELCVGGVVKAKVRRKEGSRYWTLDELEPVDMTPAMGNTGAQQGTGSIQAEVPDPTVALRVRCLELAVASYAGHDERTNVNVITTFAMGLESYALGNTPTSGS